MFSVNVSAVPDGLSDGWLIDLPVDSSSWVVSRRSSAPSIPESVFDAVICCVMRPIISDHPETMPSSAVNVSLMVLITRAEA